MLRKAWESLFLRRNDHSKRRLHLRIRVFVYLDSLEIRWRIARELYRSMDIEATRRAARMRELDTETNQEPNQDLTNGKHRLNV